MLDNRNTIKTFLIIWSNISVITCVTFTSDLQHRNLYNFYQSSLLLISLQKIWHIWPFKFRLIFIETTYKTEQLDMPNLMETSHHSLPVWFHQKARLSWDSGRIYNGSDVFRTLSNISDGTSKYSEHILNFDGWSPLRK